MRGQGHQVQMLIPTSEKAKNDGNRFHPYWSLGMSVEGDTPEKTNCRISKCENVDTSEKINEPKPGVCTNALQTELSEEIYKVRVRSCKEVKKYSTHD